jgi:hypothetical protein
MVDGVVQEVAPRRFDGAAHAVGAHPSPLPLVVTHAVEAGATDFLAAIFPVGADAAGSRARTWELLRSLQETALTF